MRKVNLALPRHHAEYVKRKQNACGMQFGIGLFRNPAMTSERCGPRGCGAAFGLLPFRSGCLVRSQASCSWLAEGLRPLCFLFALRVCRNAGGGVGQLAALPAGCFWLVFLEDEQCVFLVAFGGEADVVELDFIDAELGYVLGQGDVIVLHLGVRRIGPDQLAVLAPRGVVLAGLDGEFGMIHDQALVAEDGDAGDGVHVLLVQEMHELRHVVDVNLVLAEQRMLEGNVDAAVGVLDIEDDGIAADFAPVLDDCGGRDRCRP